MVVLYDENGNVVGGTDSEGVLTAEQIILARVPENGALGEVKRRYLDILDRSLMNRESFRRSQERYAQSFTGWTMIP